MPHEPPRHVSDVEAATGAVILAFLVRIAFRHYESYSIAVHMALLLGAPLILVASISLSGGAVPVLENASLFAVTFSAFLFALVLFTVLYRLSPLHPLAKYPGPLFNRVSMFTPAFMAIKGNKSKRYRALHEQYGDVIRTGPNELSIRDPTALSGLWKLPRGPNFIGGMLSDKNLPMIGIQNYEEHMHRRRCWNRGMSVSALKQYEFFVTKRARQLVSCLESHQGKVFLNKWFNCLAYDITCDMAFGGGTELLRDGDDHHAFSMIDETMVIASFMNNLPWLGVYLGHIPGAARPLEKLKATAIGFVTRRLQQGSVSRDLFFYLNNEDLPESAAPPPSDVIDDGILAVVAGSDTTSSTLTNIFYCVLRNPKSYQSLKAEVDKHYPAGDNPYSTQHHSNMPYLQAVIYETLRLFPPATLGSQREVPHGSSAVISGNVVLPPGTRFFMPPYVIHRDARNFVCPDTFWPERWLVASGALSVADAHPPHGVTEEAFRHNDGAFIAFGHGPMNCVGRSFALQILRTTVCALVQRFEMKLWDGWNVLEYEEEMRDYVTLTRPNLPVKLAARW